MKNLKKIVAALIIMAGFNSALIAETADSSVPSIVAASFTKKYPSAHVKSWHIKNATYIAKANIDGHSYFVSFDKSGNWLNTAYNIPWQWNLPAGIKTAYNKSNYNTWNVYYSKKVEKTSGEYYQLMVSDVNLHVGPNTRPLYNSDKMLEFKADGTLASVTDITKDPVPNN